MKKIAFILGTRPEVVKLYPLIADCVSRAQDFFILHTNQHYDENMDAVFFRDLGIPLPKYNLGVGSGSHGAQIGKMLVGIEEVLQKEMPDVVVVQGDTNTVLAGALVASRCNIKVAHVEAGLRSYDRTMPEEVNRILTDSISDFLFCPTEKQKEILLAENIPDNKIFVTGNTIVDAINRSIKIAESKSTILNELGIEKDKYFLLTCHRPDNTDNKDNFEKIIRGVSVLADKHNVKCIFPMHPRLKKYLPFVSNYANLVIVDPVNYFDSLVLQKHSKMIFTDSGGIQEESCILEKKCIILRLNTERPETVEVGGAMLVSEISENEIQRCYDQLIIRNVHWKNPFGNGKSSEIILDQLIPQHESAK